MVCKCVVCGQEFNALLSSDVCGSCSEVEQCDTDGGDDEINPAQGTLDI